MDRLFLLRTRHNLLHPPELVVYRRRLHGPGLAPQLQAGLQPPPHRRAPRLHLFHRQVLGRHPLLQEMPDQEAGPRAPLLVMQALRPQDGPPLPMAGDLRRAAQLQALLALPNLRLPLLLGLLRRVRVLGVDRNGLRCELCRHPHAGQLHPAGRDLRHNRTRHHRLHSLAHNARLQRTHHNRKP